MKKILIHQLLILIIAFSVHSKRVIKHRYLEDGAEEELVAPDDDIMEEAPQEEDESDENEDDGNGDEEEEEIIHRGNTFKNKVVLLINQSCVVMEIVMKAMQIVNH